MATFETLEQARAYFVGDRFAMRNGITLDALDDDCAQCSLQLQSDMHSNAAGGVMGGVYFTLADFAFAVASNNMHRSTVALDAQIHFLRPAKGTRLFAETHCVKDGKTTCVYDVTITDEAGKQIAKVTATGYKL